MINLSVEQKKPGNLEPTSCQSAAKYVRGSTFGMTNRRTMFIQYFIHISNYSVNTIELTFGCI